MTLYLVICEYSLQEEKRKRNKVTKRSRGEVQVEDRVLT